MRRVGFIGQQYWQKANISKASPPLVPVRGLVVLTSGVMKTWGRRTISPHKHLKIYLFYRQKSKFFQIGEDWKTIICQGGKFAHNR